MIDEFLLFSGNDIPFIEAQLVIHQPSCKEIAYIGEQNFRIGCEFLMFSKNQLGEEDRMRLNSLSDFEILMSMMTQKNIAFLQQPLCAKEVLSLIFPQYTLKIADKIYLQRMDEEEIHSINKDNFSSFKSILKEIFCLNAAADTEEYNPAGAVAAKMAERFKQRRQKLNKAKADQSASTVYGRYISVLAVGEQKNVQDLLNYTLYQLTEEFDRYMLKYQSDRYFSMRVAGASGMDEPEDWTKNLHKESNSLKSKK